MAEMSNAQRKWRNKVNTLANMKGSTETKRQRAIHQMKLNGDQWVRMMNELGIKSSFANSKKKKNS